MDKGAEDALLNHGSSLLPAGIYKISGVFEKGDVVEVYGESGLIGKGEVLYSSEDIKRLMGKRSEEICDDPVFSTIEVIHRDRWVRI